MNPAQNHYIHVQLPADAVVKSNPTCEVHELCDRVNDPEKRWKITVLNHTGFKLVPNEKTLTLFINDRPVDMTYFRMDQQITLYCLEGRPNNLCLNRTLATVKLSENFFMDFTHTSP